MPRLKIAHLCWESLHAVREGGLSPAATHLAEVLSGTHEVHFFTRGDGPDRTIGGHGASVSWGIGRNYGGSIIRGAVEGG